jgi:rRNA maturation RNase YbeY
LKISFVFADDFSELISDKKEAGDKVKMIVSSMQETEKVTFGEIEIVLMNRHRLREYNKSHLKHDYETDIITFDLSEPGQIGGQLMISPEVILENSGRFKTEFEAEFLRVIIHGLLHLTGYDDNDASSKKKMRKKENEYLKIIENAGKGN